MKLYKYLMALALTAVALSGPIDAAERRGGNRGNSQETEHEDELNNKDTQIVKTFLKSKAKDKAGEISNLTVSGDVRTEWRHMNEKYKGKNLRGGDAFELCDKCLPVSRNDFDQEFNLRFEYVLEKAWCAAHLQFDDPMGISDNDCCCDLCNNCPKEKGEKKDEKNDKKNRKHKKNKKQFTCEDRHCSFERFHGSGNGRNVDLKRAYVGYNFYTKDSARFDLELGRRKMYDIFESEIQFLSRFDGAIFEYSDKAECFADWYVKLAGFLIDERTNHFGMAMEAALFNIYDSDVDVKYSLIDWQKRGHSRCAGRGKDCDQSEVCSSDGCDINGKGTNCACLEGARNPRGFKFLNSQLTVTYHFNPDLLHRPMEIYGAIVYNHLAKQASRSHKNKGLAGYVGLTIGKVKKEGDWSLDMQYQYVQEYAIAFDDEAGIGLGDIQSDCCGGVVNPGYKGCKFEALYAITDHLSLDSIVEYASSTQHASHQYWKFELEAIYAF